MRKLWFCRRGVSEIIAGIIVLAVFLIALVSMIAISSQYDVYESVFTGSQQREINMYSENLMGAYPGVINGTIWQISCGGTTCYNYTILLNNLGIGTQIARIYINTTSGTSPSGCNGLCVLDPATSPGPYKFRASDAYVNAGESFHTVVVWLPVRLPAQCAGGNTACNTIKVTTTRGRIFLFMYPFPILTTGAGKAQGGTGIYIGPLIITFERTLLTYTTKNGPPPCQPPPQFCSPPIPIGQPYFGQNGYWTIPTGKLVLYVKIQTDAKAVDDVYLTAQSVFELVRFDNPGAVNYFFIIAPISMNYCLAKFNSTAKVNCDSRYGYGSGNNGNNGDPSNIVAYQACADQFNVPPPPQQYNTATCSNAPYNDGPRYLIPKPTIPGQRGKPVIVAFAVSKASGETPDAQNNQFPKGISVTSFLGLSFVYNDGTGSYVYGVTLPFIALCINDPDKLCSV